MTDKELIWLSAFRYALSRRTYIVSVVCDWLKSHKLSTEATKLIIREIEEAEEKEKDVNKFYYKPLGDDCDKKRWLELKTFLRGTK